MSAIIWIVAAIALAAFIWISAVFNSLVSKKNRVKNAWSDIDVQLKRRHDLIPNLIETVKEYKEYESAILTSVTQARTNAMGARSGGIAKRDEAENALAGALRGLFAVAENYPRLEASENFRKLQDELSALENDIQAARRYYNASVRELNTAVQVFPARTVAGVFGFGKEDFFGADEGEKGAVQVSF